MVEILIRRDGKKLSLCRAPSTPSSPAKQQIHEDGKNIDYQKIYSAFISYNSRLTPITIN